MNLNFESLMKLFIVATGCHVAKDIADDNVKLPELFKSYMLWQFLRTIILQCWTLPVLKIRARSLSVKIFVFYLLFFLFKNKNINKQSKQKTLLKIQK